MPTPTAQLTARLRAAAETAIAQVLATRALPAEATLADIEQSARRGGQAVAHAIATALAEESAAEGTARPDCPQCEKK